MGFLEALYLIATQYMAEWGYWGLIVGMALESACFPMPSEIVLPFGGYLVSKGVLSFWFAVASALLGGTIGSVVAYVVGYYGGRPFVLRYGRYFFVRPSDVKRADVLFEKYGSKIVFWARFLPVVRTFISLPAGITRMEFWRFLGYTIAGAVPWTILFVYAGVKLGENWDHVRSMFERFDVLIVLVLIGVIGYWIIGHLKES